MISTTIAATATPRATELTVVVVLITENDLRERR